MSEKEKETKEEELNKFQQCAQEIDAVLLKHNCNLVTNRVFQVVEKEEKK